MRNFSSGARLKYYRGLLNISQRDLVSKKLSLSMVNLLESDKRQITAGTAVIIINKLNEIAEKKNIQILFSIQDLLLSEKECARIICTHEINNLETLGFEVNRLIEISQIIVKYCMDELYLKVFTKIAEHYYKTNNYDTSSEYLITCFNLIENLDKKIDMAVILNKIGSCYYMKGDLNSAINYYERSYKEYLSQHYHDGEYNIKILYNLSLVYINLKDFSNGFMHLEKLLSLENLNAEQLSTCLILKANALLDTERYEEALIVYKEIIDKDSKYIYIILNNMAKTFCRLSRIGESIEYFTASINNQISTPSPHTTLSLKGLAGVYQKEKRINEAIIFYNYAFNNAFKFKQMEETLSLSHTLLALYKETNQTYKFEYHYNCLSVLENEGHLTKEQLREFSTFKIV